MHTFDIDIKGLSKIEGHADLHVKVKNNKVEDVELLILENRRFYEQAVQNADYNSVPQSIARVCGTCSLAHTICNLEAIERALKIIPSDQTILMRQLAMNGLMIRDHALHLYFFSLPDLLKKDSILDFNENDKYEHKLLHDSFDVKQAGNDLSTLVAGRAVHPMFPIVGGFSSFPKPGNVKQVIVKLKAVRQKTIDLIDVFGKWDENFKTKTEFASLINADFNFLSGNILAAGETLDEQDYINHLNEFLIPYSTSKGYEFEGKVFMVGSLARLNQNKKGLHKDTRKDVDLSVFPTSNVFQNNLAQAIEILHSIDASIEILEKHHFKKEDPATPQKNSGEGVGVIEAPRGLLYHYVDIKDGKVKKAKIIVPSSQNQIKMEKDIGMLVESMLPKNGKKNIEWEIEKLIRAYDPCMSCAAHFLKVKWE
ncbi:MAG: nickel-dependent hydrogenase large subunit [Candidatus Aenigmatarchaeota archaeon]